jgi:ArsR family transcriptional regulator
VVGFDRSWRWSPRSGLPAGRSCPAKVSVCELVPLFGLSQPTVLHHLKMLRKAGIVGSEREGLWASYYNVIPDALDELSGWLQR